MVILYIVCYAFNSKGQSAFLSLYEDVKKEDLKLLELTDSLYQEDTGMYPHKHALVNHEKIYKGQSVSEIYRNIFCRNFSKDDDTLSLFSICDTSKSNIDLYYPGLSYNKKNIALFKIRIGSNCYLLFNMLIGYFDYETVICSIYNSKTNEITDMIDVLRLYGCGYMIEMKSQFCVDCSNYQIASTYFLSMVDPSDTVGVASYNTDACKIITEHFIKTTLPQYTKSQVEIQDKEYHIELPPYDELFKKKK